MKPALALALAFCLLATPAAVFAREHSPEWKLAVIDNGTPPSAHTFAVYARVLDQLQRRCTNPRIRLADFSVTSQGLLSRHHIDWKNIHILRGVAGAIPRSWPRRGCSEIFAAYVTTAI